jgi:tyrosine-protein kinase Etk/Wzc
MTNEPIERPYSDQEPERFDSTPHLSDYWQVIARRLWLVLLIFTVTTASSIWALSRQETIYRASMSLQVNDPVQRGQGLVNIPRLSGMDIFVDPIQSEIQVLNSSSIKASVVDSLGMRLTPVGGKRKRSELVRDAWVAPEAPNGRYRLVYNPEGTQAQFMMADGTRLGEATVGTALDAGFVRFTLQPPIDEDRIFELDILPTQSVIGEISLTAEGRDQTNIIDVGLVHGDPYLTPQILNFAGLALREKGAERVRKTSRADMAFIQSQLDSAGAKLQKSREAITEFKTTQAFTTLSLQEQRLVTQSQTITEEIEKWDRQRQVLTGLVQTIEDEGVAAADLVAVLSELPPGTNTEVRRIITDIENREDALRSLLTQDRLSPGHPRVIAVRAEINERGSQLSDAAEASLRVVEDRLSALGERERELLVQQARFPEMESTMTDLRAQVEMDAETFQLVLSQLYQARITDQAAAPYVEVLDPAQGVIPIQPRGRVNVFLGGLLGLILGVGAAFFLEYLDRTVRTSSDVESLLGIPVLGVIPRLRRLDDEIDGAGQMAGRGLPLVVAMDPLDPAAEAYRNLRMNLMFMSTDDEPIRTVLFSSPGPSEGKSTTAVNFAVMLAQQGQRVLMIDADLRRPSLHRALDVLREPGLTNLLIGDAQPRETVRPNVLPNLDFLPSGPFPPNPSELLNSKTMVRILEEFEGRYDQIIIDSPPVLAVTDAAILAVHTDGAVLVLRSGETEQRAAERSVDQLRRLGVRVFGAVLNEVSAANPDESYYLQYYYSYQPAGTPTQTGWQRLREGFGKVRFLG